MSQENNTKPARAKKTLLSGVNRMLVLGLLEEYGECTGAFMTQEIAKRSNGFVSPAGGSIVSLMQGLQEDGFVTSKYVDRTEGTKGRKWRPYELTELGRMELAKEKEMWKRFEECVQIIMCF